MNPYKILGVLKDTAITSIAFGPLVAGLATSIGFCVSKHVEADKKYDEFQNSAIFQELKAEELEDLSKLEITYNEAKEKHEAGEMSAQDFLKTEKQFNEKQAYIESEEFVYNGMKLAGVYEDYNKTKSQGFYIGVFAIPASAVFGCAWAVGGDLFFDYAEPGFATDFYKAKKWEETHSKNSKKEKELAK